MAPLKTCEETQHYFDVNSKLERSGFYSQGKMKMLYPVNINKTNEALYQLHGILFKLRLRATHKNCFSFLLFLGRRSSRFVKQVKDQQ